VDEQLKSPKNTNNQRVRINTVVMGEPAAWLNEWKRRGLVTSYTDAIVQALRALNEKITEQDLKSAQLRNIERTDSY
jgi:Arc/MetJ-type ribon-helix-helix transcriptional regulator